MNYWLVKSEPSVYSFAQLVADKRTVWDGVRNHLAKRYLSEMQKGDIVLYYHSNEERAVVGIATVAKEAFPDASADDPRWLAVELAPKKALNNPVPLSTLKSTPELASMILVKQGRLSVTPVTKEEFEKILEISA